MAKQKVVFLCRNPFHNAQNSGACLWPKQALLEDGHSQGVLALKDYIAACFLWITAEALSLNTGPISKIVVRISPLNQHDRKIG